MLVVDEARILAQIEAAKPRVVVFTAPDGLLAKISEIACRVEEKYGIEVYVSGDPCYGSCDILNNCDLEDLGVDLAFHVGHKTAESRFVPKTIMVDVHDDVSFLEVSKKAAGMIGECKTIGLCALGEHLHSLKEVRTVLEDAGFTVLVGRGRGRLLDGQILGCDFSTAYEIGDSVDVLLLLGQSAFHGIGIALSTGKRTYMLDPYLNDVRDLGRLAEERSTRAILAIYKARDAERFGLIVGMKKGQTSPQRVHELKKGLEEHGKEVQLISMREITEERLLQFPRVEAFVQTACPRISVDGYGFTRPVLSVPQAEALMKVLDGEEPGEFFRRPYWR